MTVRWKPLLILSGLFVVVALAGLMTIATVMGSRKAGDFVARARVERKAKQFEKAKLDYQIALKSDGRDASLHEELADLYAEWLAEAPPEKRADLRAQYLGALAGAANPANNGAKRPGPRRRLLADALRRDDQVEQVRWAKALAALAPADPDAAFVLASEELDGLSPNLTEVRRLVKVVDDEQPRRARADWLAARLAVAAGDKARLAQALDAARQARLDAQAPGVDRMALLRLRALDLDECKDLAAMPARVDAVKRDALFAADEPEIPSTRIARISLLIEDLQKNLIERGVRNPQDREALHGHGESLDEVAEAIFTRTLDLKGGADLNVYLAYADHLRFRDHRDRALKVVQQALASPAFAKQGATEVGLGLHALAIEALLANLDDKGRYDAAAPHIRALLDSKVERFAALGHLFQGAIELERAGLVADAKAGAGAEVGVSRAEQVKLRASALEHLRVAANQLPHLAEAQARYGVALILNQESAMGRQYLQRAQRLGNERDGKLEPQYLIWTAWSVVQAGYPEDAEPIVRVLLEAVDQGRLPRTFEGTLHLLNGEIHQARRSPEDLKVAIEEYRRSFTNGQDTTPAVELRLAQIETMLGRSEAALKRIDWLASKGKAGPAAENLAVLILSESKRDADAQARLAKARLAYPESSELAITDAALREKAGHFEEADKALADHLAAYPDDVAAAQKRAQVLASDLRRPEDARKLLAAVADRAENSAPMVQLALLEMQTNDHAAAAETIARIKRRWKDAATSDLLEAQQALYRKDNAAASAHFEAALQKDPSNKVVRFWKAQLDGQANPEGASQVFEQLAGEKSIKEVQAGLSLVAASQSALAGMAMENGDLDSAIGRYREMLKSNNAPSIARPIRWQIVAALAAKKEWPAARAEMAGLLSDPKNPPSAEERVRAATYYRLAKEDGPALAEVDAVLKADPTFPGAVVTRAEILARTGKHPEAVATIRRAVAATPKGQQPPAVFFLMIAAVETVAPPVETGFGRALVALDQGLAQSPDDKELVKAKSLVLARTRGPEAGAAFLEAKAQGNPAGPYRPMLLDFYRERGDLASAERVAEVMARDEPKSNARAATLVQILAAESARARQAGDDAAAKGFDDRAAALVYDDRARFPDDPSFLQLDCELAIRRGDYARAMGLTQEIDGKAKSAPVGPLLRAQVALARNQPREAEAAYAEALGRNPRQPEARLELARLSLLNGKADEAIRQARHLQDADPDKPVALKALLIEARATALQRASSAETKANQAKALARLDQALRDHPDFAEASRLAAEIQARAGDRGKAVATLKAALKANPNDDDALALALQLLAEPRGPKQGAPKADLDAARDLARLYADNDQKGDNAAAAAIGFTRAGQPELALPYAEKAAALQKSTVAHLGLGDLLLTLSEGQPDPTRSRKLLDRALAEYDGILAQHPDLVEAVNNKAWIYHEYLNRSQDALGLAQDLATRVDAARLPGEFYDTLGSIQGKLGQKSEAEDSFRRGLAKAPDHPVLNFHMGQLLMADKAKARQATDYLKAAQAGSDRLPPKLADQLNLLLLQVPAN